MTKLNITIDLDKSCNLLLQDTTGLQSNNVDTGFSGTTNVISGNYSINDGFFINCLTYSAYDKHPVLINDCEEYLLSTTIPSAYKLHKDGNYTITRFFILSDTYYNNNSVQLAGKDIYYTDGLDIYTVISDITYKIKLTDLLVNDITNGTLLSASISFLSLCNLKNCYQTIMLDLLNKGKVCDNNNISLNKDRDFIFMTIQVVTYLKELGNLNEAQKIIESLDACNSICKSYDCGCHG